VAPARVPPRAGDGQRPQIGRQRGGAAQMETAGGEAQGEQQKEEPVHAPI